MRSRTNILRLLLFLVLLFNQDVLHFKLSFVFHDVGVKGHAELVLIFLTLQSLNLLVAKRFGQFVILLLKLVNPEDKFAHSVDHISYLVNQITTSVD